MTGAELVILRENAASDSSELSGSFVVVFSVMLSAFS